MRLYTFKIWRCRRPGNEAMHAGHPPQQVAATVHVANKTRLDLCWLHCVSLVCCRSPGAHAVSAKFGSVFRF